MPCVRRSQTRENGEVVRGRRESRESTTESADDKFELRSLVPLIDNYKFPTQHPFLRSDTPPGFCSTWPTDIHMLNAASLARANLPKQVHFQQGEFTFRYRAEEFFQTNDPEDYEDLQLFLRPNAIKQYNCWVDCRAILPIHMYGALMLPLRALVRAILNPDEGVLWRSCKHNEDALLPDFALVREGEGMCCKNIKPGSVLEPGNMLACLRFETQHAIGNEEMEKIFDLASEYSLQPVFDEATGMEIPSMLCGDEPPRSRGRRRRRTVALETVIAQMYRHDLDLAVLTNLCVWLVLERDGDVITISKINAQAPDDKPNSEGFHIMLDLTLRVLEPDLKRRLRFPAEQ